MRRFTFPLERVREFREKQVAVEESSPRLKWISKAIVRAYFKLFHQYEALGQEHLPPAPPVLIITNHVSNLDVPAFALADKYVGSRLVGSDAIDQVGKAQHFSG